MKTLTQVVRRIKSYMLEKDDSVRELVATVELERRFEKAYSQNDRLIWEDNLYDVLMDVSEGDDIVTYESGEPNPNIKLSENVCDILSDISETLSEKVKVVITPKSFSVTSDGASTTKYQTLLNSLYTDEIYPYLSGDNTIKGIINLHIDISGTNGCSIDSTDSVISGAGIQSSIKFNGMALVATSSMKKGIYEVSMSAEGSTYLYSTNISTVTNYSTNAAPSGTEITVSFNEIHIYG